MDYLQEPVRKRERLSGADAAVKDHKARDTRKPRQQPQKQQRLPEAHGKAHAEIVQQAENAEDQYEGIYNAAVFHIAASLFFLCFIDGKKCKKCHVIFVITLSYNRVHVDSCRNC